MEDRIVTKVTDALAGGEGAGLYAVGLTEIGFVETKGRIPG